MKRFLDRTIKYRYLLALVAFIIGLSFNLNGSSLGSFNNFGLRATKGSPQSQTVDFDNPKTDSLTKASYWLPTDESDGALLGVPRNIRSDEWKVQTPFYISQANTGNHLVNKSYALSGQNMIVAYNAPVKHPSIIGKPFNWGFLFLGASRGLSWYWCFKLIALLLLAFEFSMILTKKNKYLSLVGSFWITFTPAVQWWFMQHLGDVVFDSLLIMVGIYHYFRAKSRKKKLGLTLLILIGLVGFPLIIYPAFQVPFAYLLGIFVVIELVKAIKKKQVHLFDWLVMALTLLLAGTIVGTTLLASWDAIQASLATVYPGHRISTGGRLLPSELTDFLVNIALPFGLPKHTNQVELSTSYHFVWAIVFILPFMLRKADWKKNLFGLATLLLSLLLGAYALIGIPVWLAKLSLLSYVTSIRAWQAASVLAVSASIWFIGYVWEQRDKLNPKTSILYLGLLALATGLLSWGVLVNPHYPVYPGRRLLLVLLAVLLLAFLAVLFRWKRLFAILLLGLTLASGMTINPVSRGLKPIEDKKLSLEIKQLVKTNPQALWMSDSTEWYNYVQMFGARSIDGVRFYPDKKLMKKLDPQGKLEHKWNRYSHLRYHLTDAATSMTNPSPDVLAIDLNLSELQKLKVNYILTTRQLDALYGSQFKQVYSDKDGNYIYQYLPEPT